jgi:hypothetical protein
VTSTFAYDFAIDGIYYNKLADGKSVEVTSFEKYTATDSYKGNIVIHSSVIYNGITYIVTSIDREAFASCTGLTSITIPNSVTNIGYAAFWDCRGLTSINVESTNSKYSSLNGILYNKEKTTLICCPPKGLKGEFIIPNSVDSIGFAACFECKDLTSITIPNSVTNISRQTFCFCTGLSNVTIPESVTRIGDEAFCCCSKLTSITIPNSVTSIGRDAFERCEGLQSVIIPNSVTSIGGEAFEFCKGLTSVTISSSLTNIGAYVFEGCIRLTSVTIPNSVINIGYNAFAGCDELKSVTIPNSVTNIGDDAFAGCYELTSVAIPNSVINIGDRAFSGCSHLVEIYSYPKKPLTLKSETFSNVPSTCTLHVPVGSKTLYKAMSVWKNFSNIVEDLIGNGTQVVGITVAPAQTTAQIRWNKVDDASYYILNVYLDSTYTHRVLSQLISNCTCTVSNLTDSTKYYFTLTAYNNVDTLLAQTDSCFTTLPKEIKIANIDISQNCITISWIKDDNASNYIIYLYSDEKMQILVCTITIDANGNIVTRADAANLSCKLNGLTSSMKYYYRLTACDKEGNEYAAVEGNFTTQQPSAITSASNSETIQSTKFFTPDGTPLTRPAKGINIRRTTYSDGKVNVEKIVKR